MHFHFLAGLVTASFALPITADSPAIIKNTTIFAPPTWWTSHSTSYARPLLLNQACEKNNVLLTTFTLSDPSDQTYIPVYKSVDDGVTWEELSRIYFDDTMDIGMLMQPFLLELPIQVGNYPAGTILATGNIVPIDFNSTNIVIYASTDKGENWNFVSIVATGAAPNSQNGAHPVWEPFISIYKRQVVVYYSDSRDPLHAQKLSHQTSTDLLTWGPAVNDVVTANYTLRPGMTIVAQMGNGKYILTYELGPEPHPGSRYPVHYRIADSPLEFENVTDYRLQAQDGTVPNSGPYVVWTPAGGPNGTLVVSDGKYSELFLNTKNGDPDAWTKVTTGLGISYTRALQVMRNSSVILVVDGGLYGGRNTSVTAGEFVIPGAGTSLDANAVCNK